MKTTHQQKLAAATLAGALTLATTVAQGGEIGHYGGGVPRPGCT